MVSNPLATLLERQPVIILDGAMGTELERRGIDLTGSKLWSAQLLIDNPSVVQDVHLAYLRAGADVVTTATYQASLDGFLAAGLDEGAAHDCIRLAVQLAADARRQWLAEQQQEQQQEQLQEKQEQQQGQHQRQQEKQQQQGGASVNAGQHGHDTAEDRQPSPGDVAGRQRPLVGLSCGSYGACLCDGSEFTGTYATTMSEQQLADWHLRRLTPVMQHPEVDLLCFETVPCLAEVRAICRLLSTHPGLANARAWVSCSCRDDQHTCHGELFASQVVSELWRCEQVVGIGVNCTNPAHVARLLSDATAMLASLKEQQQAQQQGQANKDGQQGGEGKQPQGQGQEQAQQQQSPGPEQHTAGSATHLASRSAPPPILLCYPNSGEAWDGEHRCWLEQSSPVAAAGEFAGAARAWVAAGARAVGGCCRTGPEHIAALRRTLLDGGLGGGSCA